MTCNVWFIMNININILTLHDFDPPVYVLYAEIDPLLCVRVRACDVYCTQKLISLCCLYVVSCM